MYDLGLFSWCKDKLIFLHVVYQLEFGILRKPHLIYCSSAIKTKSCALIPNIAFEAHGLGLLAAEAWLTLVGAQPLNLGPQTPLWDLVQSAQQHRAEVLLLGFTAAAPAPLVQDTLSELRSKVPPHIEVWVGGQHPLLQRKPPAHITVLSDIADIGPAVQSWRQAQGLRG